MRIATIGFPEDQRVKLEKIFKLSKQTRYSLVELDITALPDLLLVFGLDMAPYSVLANLPSTFSSRIILVGRGKPSNTVYAHLGYPLVSSRVLRALDKMTRENEEFTVHQSADEIPIAAENRFDKYTDQANAAVPEVQGKDCYKVLVVDDNEVMQQALNNELQQMSVAVDVHFASSGEQSLERVAKSAYDFIFLDVVMPGIDGFQACAEMRKRPELKKTPIIMLTSKTSPMDEVKGIMSGCSTYLTKPIDHKEFQKVISRVASWVDEFKEA